MKKNVILSEEREIPLLLFLWQWKVSTTAALIHKFGPDQESKLSNLFPEIPQQAAGFSSDANLVSLLLDTRKSPHIASTYRGFQLGDFVD